MTFKGIVHNRLLLLFVFKQQICISKINQTSWLALCDFSAYFKPIGDLYKYKIDKKKYDNTAQNKCLPLLLREIKIISRKFMTSNI